MMKVLRKLFLFIVIFSAIVACQKEQSQLETIDIQGLELLSSYPSWVETDDDVFIFISDKLAVDVLNSKSESEAKESLNVLLNKSQLNTENYEMSVVSEYRISAKELVDLKSILYLSDKYEDSNYLELLQDRHQELLSSKLVGLDIEQKVISRGCSLGQALWSVASGVGTMISCGSAVATCVPTAGVTCVGCAISAAGTAQAMRCWFN